MKKYSIFPFTAGKVYFATMSSDPNFQIDITTQEGIVFFDSDVYPCYMVHNSVKYKLIESKMTGFHFPKGNIDMEFTFENKERFFSDKPLPNWSWIVFDKDESKDVFINDNGEIICDNRFVDILKYRQLKRSNVQEIIEKNDDIENVDNFNDKNFKLYKDDKNFNLPVFLIILLCAILVGVILYY